MNIPSRRALFQQTTRISTLTSVFKVSLCLKTLLSFGNACRNNNWVVIASWLLLGPLCLLTWEYTWELIAFLAVWLKIRMSWGNCAHFYSRKKPSCYNSWVLVPWAVISSLPYPFTMWLLENQSRSVFIARSPERYRLLSRWNSEYFPLIHENLGEHEYENSS